MQWGSGRPRLLGTWIAVVLAGGLLTLAADSRESTKLASEDASPRAAAAKVEEPEATPTTAKVAATAFLAPTTTAPPPTAPPPTAPPPTAPPPTAPPPTAPPPTAPPRTAPPATAPPPPPPTSPPPTAAPLPDVPSVERSILDHHNAQRAAAGIGPLQRSSCLDGVAWTWSARLASTGRLQHNPSYGTQTQACVNWSKAAENVAYNTSSSQLMSTWMGSGGHRANILDPALTTVGIGVTVDASGTIWATVDFTG